MGNPLSPSLSKKNSSSSSCDVPAEENSNSSSSRSSDPEDQVKVTVKGQVNKTKHHFVVKRSKTMKKLFEKYCNKTSQEIQAMQFLYKNNRVYGFHTPLALGVKKGKRISIDAMTHVHGGGGDLAA